MGAGGVCFLQILCLDAFLLEFHEMPQLNQIIHAGQIFSLVIYAQLPCAIQPLLFQHRVEVSMLSRFCRCRKRTYHII